MTTSPDSGRVGPWLDYEPWRFPDEASPQQRDAAAAHIDALRVSGVDVGEGVYVATSAVVLGERIALGDRSYVAAHAHVGGDVVLGADCSVNVGAAVRGRVSVGRAVRIGTHATIVGFDHGFEDTNEEIFRQPLTSAGITIGDDVWIGANALVVDGVTIGDHAVVGAGAVVVKDVPAWAVVVGSPARVVRDRRESRVDATSVRTPAPSHQSGASPWTRIGQRARADVAGLVASSWDGDHYRDRPGAAPTVRAHCDAIELSMLIDGAVPRGLTADGHRARLISYVDPDTGEIAELGERAASVPAGRLPRDPEAYHVLSVGYALDLLGSALPRIPRSISDARSEQMVAELGALDWRRHAWGAGALVDAVGTALAWRALGTSAHGRGLDDTRAHVWRWLSERRDPETSLWGDVTLGWREPVNGTYRLLRGTAAAWGLERGRDDRLIASALTRARDLDWESVSACDALDVTYLLWWGRCDGKEQPAAREVAAQVNGALTRAWDGGMPFRVGEDASLQGTEMWLATAWYAAALTDDHDELGYVPAGVHRPGPTAPPVSGS